MGTPTIKAAANLAVLWGTENVVANNGNAVLNGTIVETLTITPKNADPIDIEGNAGFSAILAHLDDGFSAKATAIYDANKAYPSKGDTVLLVGPRSGNAGTTNYNCNFWSWGFTRSKKNPAQIELNFTHRPDINGAPA